MPGLIIKALMAIGLRAIPSWHDERVHDAKNKETAAMAGFRIVSRRSRAVSQAIAADPDDLVRISATADTMRADTDHVRGMLAGLMRSMEPEE